VTTVIVYPSVAVRSGKWRLDGGIESDGTTSLAGEAMPHGPITIAWDQAAGAARHPERGHNVVFHEFAHTLDMTDDGSDGVPRMPNPDAYRRWKRVLGAALTDLPEGLPRLIDTYGANGPVELFAVVTEALMGLLLRAWGTGQPSSTGNVSVRAAIDSPCVVWWRQRMVVFVKAGDSNHRADKTRQRDRRGPGLARH
jgi:hypothetical protein